ncbi:hypothetical protein RvY_08356 [Ramazzottius varieornatus]|uniref:Uncharacterized protein n=1 Tax=Ramazzottius varieornatus TaxID=947166 RepID=A0A1D1VDN9_RAMVA|nr:hypothetical protein RvY_08356 [Ramazzottius varieornatus]
MYYRSRVPFRFYELTTLKVIIYFSSFYFVKTLESISYMCTYSAGGNQGPVLLHRIPEGESYFRIEEGPVLH